MSDIVERLRFIAIDNAETLTDDEHNTLSEAVAILSEAEKREKEARPKALEEAAKVAEAEYKRHCTGSGFDSQPARSTAHRILEALKALQSEER